MSDFITEVLCSNPLVQKYVFMCVQWTFFMFDSYTGGPLVGT